ncbi:MAG: maleylpyruvate isomerase family mycothiol-dependent enzyme, partial [Streptosporangiales bacterium]
PRGLFIEADAHRWAARMGPERAEVQRGWDGVAAGPGDCTVSGPAPELYLMLWNRRGPAGLEVTGDPGVLERWRGGVRVTWR